MTALLQALTAPQPSHIDVPEKSCDGLKIPDILRPAEVVYDKLQIVMNEIMKSSQTGALMFGGLIPESLLG